MFSIPSRNNAGKKVCIDWLPSSNCQKRWYQSWYGGSLNDVRNSHFDFIGLASACLHRRLLTTTYGCSLTAFLILHTTFHIAVDSASRHFSVRPTTAFTVVSYQPIDRHIFLDEPPCLLLSSWQSEYGINKSPRWSVYERVLHRQCIKCHVTPESIFIAGSAQKNFCLWYISLFPWHLLFSA